MCGGTGGCGLYQEQLLHGAGGVLVSDHHRAQHGRQIHLHPPGDPTTTSSGVVLVLLEYMRTIEIKRPCSPLDSNQRREDG